jgi:hypothetical protein
MDKTEELSLPSYEEPLAPSYEATPHAGKPHLLTAGTNLTLDPTGMFIKTLPASDAPPVYVLSATLLRVHSSTSIHVKRPESKGAESLLTVYAIGEHFISPLTHTHNKEYRSVTAARSHGALVTAGIREQVWDFSTRIPLKKGEIEANANAPYVPTDPVYMIGTAAGPGTVQKHLLQLDRGKWVDDDDEVVALQREGGAECEGMPMLSIMRDLDVELSDFLVSAWCVTMWGDVGKRAKGMSKGSGSGSGHKLSFGKFSLG